MPMGAAALFLGASGIARGHTHYLPKAAKTSQHAPIVW